MLTVYWSDSIRSTPRFTRPQTSTNFSHITMAPTRVGIIGAGIAGPILATLLKLKGYEPVVCERNDAPAEGGVGIG